ncbi:MAG: hypothetical protein BroJett015_27800 [Chloroflexota bacterium]|nr:MAG: hypothetical protein BroJett015_27800 [Chloroflexota bacterium]
MNEDTLIFCRYDFSPKKPFKNTGLFFEQLYKLAEPFICDRNCSDPLET